jgi:hypothetical protein
MSNMKDDTPSSLHNTPLLQLNFWQWKLEELCFSEMVLFPYQI